MRNALASLTSRLVVTTVALVLLVSVLIGTVTTFAMRNYLTGQLDQQVRDSMSLTLRALGSGPDAGPGPGPGLGTQLGTVTAILPDGHAGSASLATTSDHGRPYRQDVSGDAVN